MSGCSGTEWNRSESDVEFLTAFNRRVVAQRVPISGSIDLTDRCNLKCRHCYLEPADPHASLPPEMSTAQICGILDEIADAGCLYLLLTGGEPLLRDDFPAIYRHARKSGMIVTVFTNGLLINDDLIRLFREFPPQTVEISLYGASGKTYEAVTGSSTAFARVLTNARRLKDGGVPLRLKTVLLTLNRDELDAMESIARELDVSFRFDSAIFPRLDGNSDPLNYRVDPVDAVRAELTDPDRLRQWTAFYKNHNTPISDGLLYHCGAGVTTFHVDAGGWVSPCLMARHYRFELARSSFKKIWSECIPEFRKTPAGGVESCNCCDKQSLCGFCPAFFFLENNREDEYSEYLCQIGRERQNFLREPCAERSRHP